MFGSFLYIYTL